MVKQLSDAPRASGFADGAARFAELARSVKAQQIAEQQGTQAAAATDRIEPPDETWSRRYASQSIGPAGTQAVTSMTPVAHRQEFAMDLSGLRPTLARQETFARKADIVPSVTSMDMSLVRREDKPRRSWFGRLFRGA